ncbi:MAG: hypothetical protein GX853_04420, partial [Chloroflexi bacterium]|nr:hypothetical protein [Chloroflexota bacterium]
EGEREARATRRASRAKTEEPVKPAAKRAAGKKEAEATAEPKAKKAAEAKKPATKKAAKADEGAGE